MDLGKGLAAGAAFIGAAYLAAKGMDGWSWLIFAGILVMS